MISLALARRWRLGSVRFTLWSGPGLDVLLTAITFIWGSSFLVTREAVLLVGPFTLIALRFAIATLVLVALFHRRLARLTKREVRAGSLLGAVLFVSYALQTYGLRYTSASKAGFLSGLYIPLVPLLAWLLLRQWMAPGVLAGVGLSLAGVALLSVDSRFDLALGPGELLLLGSTLAIALHIVGISRFAPRADALNLTIVQLTVIALLSLAAMPLAGEPLAMPAMPVWLAALYLGVLATALALAAMNRAQQVISATRATLIYALELVWVALIGYLAGERLPWPALLGCACIFLGAVAGRLGRTKKPVAS